MTEAIEVKNVWYKYPNDTLALEDVSFFVNKGETFGILGPNGSGKTTLLLCICGVLKFQGEIKIFGKKVSQQNIYELRKNIGFVFQNPDDQLFMPTVYEDISFGPRQYGIKESEIRNMVEDVLNKLGIAGFENKSSHHLSFGEKKKVCIATALVLNPDILIFDEPTSELDPASRRELMQIIISLKSKKTILVSTHEPEIAKEICDKIIVLNKGKVVYEGSPYILNDKEFLTKNRLA